MNILLNAVTEGSAPTAQTVLDIVLNQLKTEEFSSAGDYIAVNVGYFINHNATPGTRPKVLQNAANAVVGAACFSYVEPNYNQLLNALGFTGDTANLRKCLKHIHDQRVTDMKGKKGHFILWMKEIKERIVSNPKRESVSTIFSIQKKEHWLTQSLTECSKFWRIWKTRKRTIP